MTKPQPSEQDLAQIRKWNEKALQNQFFTPDRIYMELSLFKDIPLGAIFFDNRHDEAKFTHIQKAVMTKIQLYQKRIENTIDPYFTDIGYTDETIGGLLANEANHDLIFLMAPATRFFELLMRHILLNQNHSGPAEKYTKKKIDAHHYVLEPTDITYVINTYPLKLSPKIVARIIPELGEFYRVNIELMCKDTQTFTKDDWDQWITHIDCFYFDDFPRFVKSPDMHKLQGDMAHLGRYVFARKRFDKHAFKGKSQEQCLHEIQVTTSLCDWFCDFKWLQNSDLRLTDEADVSPVDPVLKSSEDVT